MIIIENVFRLITNNIYIYIYIYINLKTFSAKFIKKGLIFNTLAGLDKQNIKLRKIIRTK
jgi:hypothetical protein